MPQCIRVADRLKKQSTEQLVTMAGAIITPSSPASPTPPLFQLWQSTWRTCGAAADDLNAALAALRSRFDAGPDVF